MQYFESGAIMLATFKAVQAAGGNVNKLME
jgi:hypothetical protein